MAFSLGSNLLDALVLAVLQEEDAYGYILTQRGKEIMNISSSTLYPVLRRLQKEGALHTYDEPHQGKNRRYYSITVHGREMLAEYMEEWEDYKRTVDKIFAGGFSA